jgi:hypothetical protein
MAPDCGAPAGTRLKVQVGYLLNMRGGFRRSFNGAPERNSGLWKIGYRAAKAVKLASGGRYEVSSSFGQN